MLRRLLPETVEPEGGLGMEQGILGFMEEEGLAGVLREEKQTSC